MSGPHLHDAAPQGVTGTVIAVTALLAACAYLAGSTRLRLRGDAWPKWRDACFTAGCAVLAYALLAPLPGGPFTAHMAQHLMIAMVAPVLVVGARPLTLLLRALPVRPRRTLLAVAHSTPATVLVFPPLAALLDLGGLWLLYRTPLFAGTHHQPLLHAAVHLHVVVSGLLFTFAVCQLDPVRRRWSLAWRATTLLAAGTAHAVLAKALYATPPPGTAFTTADSHAGAQLMYYGGDLVEVVIAVIIAVQWYTAGGRVHARRRRRAESTGTAPVTSAFH
ncbi:putative membrane protein [Lentzea fradiae]|uniref:Putative membrane protein n=1 Tax=Lentzea fradiae TaxID=200378 RepID=A0A1G8CSA0_9PSEU|nr:cytochrome c oxidase assembly protein [Lentzea fradiae]SDH48298.1 putative membrane protein [Lentzea fradiae]